MAILPLDQDGSVYLTRQFRYVLGRDSLEAVAGAIEGDETVLEAARRELREELGIEAEEWYRLGLMHLETSIVNGPVHLFLAKGLTFTPAQREGTETIKTVKIAFGEAVKMVMDSVITAGASCVIILKAKQFLKA